MSRTPQPGAVSLLRADGMASALLVTLSWWSAILLAGPLTPGAVAASATVAVGLVVLSHPTTRAALVARLAILVRRPAPPPPLPRPAAPEPHTPRIALRAVSTVRRTRAPGVVVATA